MNRIFLRALVLLGSITSAASLEPRAGAGPDGEAGKQQSQGPAEALSAGPEGIAAALERARSLADQGRLEESEVAARRILKDHGEVAEAHFLLGYVLFRQIQAATRQHGGPQISQYDQLGPALEKRAREKATASLAEYTLGARLKTPSAFDLKIVAMNYAVLGDYSDVDRWLTRALKWNPKDAESWYYLGRAKYNLNRFAEAIEAFRKCLDLRPEDAKAYDNLGLAYQGLGRGEEAVAAYKKAIELGEGAATKSPDPYLNLGGYLLEQNRAGDALPYLETARAISPQESRGHEKLGKAYTELNRLPEAKTELEIAVGLAPENAALHYMLGQVYRRLGDGEKAAAELKKSEELRGRPRSPGGRP